jgi:hypothetical protein
MTLDYIVQFSLNVCNNLGVMPRITASPNRMSRQAITMVARPNWSEQSLTKMVCHQSEKSDTITGSLDGNSGQYNHHTITPTV